MKFIHVSLLCLLGTFLFAQSQDQYVISAQGGISESATVTLSWTIGDLITETVTEDDASLTQGFHQPAITVRETTAELNADFVATVYPNPFEGDLTLDIENAGLEYDMQIMDMTGKFIWKGHSDQSHQRIALRDLPAAQYVLRVSFRDDTRSKTFEITKL